MGDESAKFDIEIGTRADTSGADDAIAALNRVEDEAKKVNDTGPSDPGGPPPPDKPPLYSEAELEVIRERFQLVLNEQLVREEMLRLLAEARVTEEDLTEIQRQRQIIATTLIEAAHEEAAGHMEVAAAMREEAEAMKLSLTYQQSANIPEAEAVVLARQRMADEAVITAQEREQVALNAELVAQEEAKLAAAEAQSKVYGRGGQVGNALKNFGVDSSVATTMGIAALAGMELYRQIEEMSKRMDEARISAEKQSAEFQKQVEQWKEMASTAQSMQDVVKVTESVNKSLEAMTEKYRDIKGESGLGDNLKGWASMLDQIHGKTRAIFDVALAGAPELASLWKKLGGDFETSTQKAQHAQSDLNHSAQESGRVYEELANKQASWFESLKSQPIADQLAALIEKEGELIEKQDKVKEGTKAWADYQKQIDEVVKSEGKVMDAQNKDIATIQKLDEEIKKLTADIAKEKGDQPKPGSQNDFTKVTNETIGRQKNDEYFHPSDTTTNVDGKVISKGGATPVANDDPTLKAFLAAAQKIAENTQKLTDKQTLRDSADKQLRGDSPGAKPDENSLFNRATPDGDESDFQQTLNERAKAVEDASKADSESAKTALESAATNFGSLPAHFDQFKQSIDTGTSDIVKGQTGVTASFAAYHGTVSEGLQSLTDAAVANDKELQRQISELRGQFNSFMDSYNA